MKLTIVSGLSGSGKSVALHALEDEGYYCIDNLPVALLPVAVDSLLEAETQIALGVDARSGSAELGDFEKTLAEIRSRGVEIELIYLQAQEETLLKRFSETRRKHPLSRGETDTPLVEAIREEKALLTEIAGLADLTIDTTHLNVHELSRRIRDRLNTDDASDSGLSVLVQSFGFKYGVPLDSDFVFDVRCLPNPHWEPRLRHQTGQQPEVISFLEEHDNVKEMFDMIKDFLMVWVPRFAAENRRYLSISIGCTGGQHRSVYMVEQLANYLSEHASGQITTRHRELP